MISRAIGWGCRAGVAVAALAILAAPRAAVAAATLELSPCRLEHADLPAAFADCGTLEVPQDPDDPTSLTLGLFVARVPSRTATPAPEPLVLINGGPGGSTVDLYLQASAAFAPTLLDRDIILVDQRGTGRSVAGLSCDTPSELELDTATPEELRAAVAECIAAFPRDPALFTTTVAVRDLDAVRSALGLERWDVYGVSYGTRVAEHYLRRYPERVGAVILDGVVPPQLTLGPDIARDAQNALDAILARCAAAMACSERFGNVAMKLEALLERFDGDSIEIMIADPTTGEPKLFELGSIHLRSVVRLMSYADTTAALLPLVIDEAYQGNYAPLAMQSDLLIESVNESIGFAMHNSVVCTEDVPFFPTVTGEDTGREADVPEPYLGTIIVDGLRTICDVWPAGRLDPDFHEALQSERPVLLLSGEDDPITPPAYANRVAAGLQNAKHLIAPGKGHSIAAVGCVPRLMRKFLETEDPTAVDGSCLADEAPMPFFLSFQGPAP